jgi:hypothetical protein
MGCLQGVAKKRCKVGMADALERVKSKDHQPMKSLFVAAFLLCSAAAFGQASALSAEPQNIRIPEHPRHASYNSMAREEPLVGNGTDSVSYERGERPLWEFGPVAPPPAPLGDVARAFRKEKMTGKKAAIVFEKQGS